MTPSGHARAMAAAAEAYKAREPETEAGQHPSAAEPPRTRDRARADAPAQATYSRAALQRKRFASQKRLAELYPDLWSVATLQRWRTLGIGPPWSLAGPRRIAYDLDEVEEWIASRKATSTADAKERGLAS